LTDPVVEGSQEGLSQLGGPAVAGGEEALEALIVTGGDQASERGACPAALLIGDADLIEDQEVGAGPTLGGPSFGTRAHPGFALL